jgi:hypothetical protein
MRMPEESQLLLPHLLYVGMLFRSHEGPNLYRVGVSTVLRGYFVDT